jgi:5-methylcytosine-specific restriction endonuclease McrA
MADSKTEKCEQVIAEMLKGERQRQAGYREKALKLYPHVCGRCTREFEGKKLKELTVHHRDNNHDYNPPDGSNWELLCIYCHDHEHTRGVQEQRSIDTPADRQDQPALAHSPFAALADRFKQQK